MPCHVTCRVLVPWPGIEPGAHQWKPEIPTPRPPGTLLSAVLNLNGNISENYLEEGSALDYLCLMGLITQSPRLTVAPALCSAVSGIPSPDTIAHYVWRDRAMTVASWTQRAGEGTWGSLTPCKTCRQLSCFQTHSAFLPWEAPGYILRSWDMLVALRHALVCFQLNPPPKPPFLSLLGFPFPNECGCLSSAVLFSFLCFCGFTFSFNFYCHLRRV